MKFCISSKRKYQFDKNKFIEGHQVEKYNRDKALVGGNTGGGVKSNSIQLQNETTTRTKTAISLYMPPSVQVSYESKYGEGISVENSGIDSSYKYFENV